jgi:diguanylate cyclase (GGDEF)-like protein/PAS domain S-box-containing protein
VPAGEAKRLLALRRLQILDTAPEPAFDDIVKVASLICEAPIALVSLVDHRRQWFKARLGLADEQTDRDVSFCSVAIEQPGPIFEVPDTHADERFSNNAMVVGPPFFRFYAGIPLVSDGSPVGTLCVLDTVPRTLSPAQRESLLALARGVLATLEYRRAALSYVYADRHLAKSERDEAVFAAAVAHARDGILLLGHDEDTGDVTRITYANTACCTMFGREFSSLVGRSIRRIATLAENQDAIDRAYDAARGGVSFAPLVFRRKDGTEHAFELSIGGLPHRSRDARTVVVLRDVTGRQAAERAVREKDLAQAEAAVLRKTEGRWRDLLSRTPAISYELDRDLRFRSSIGGGLNAIGLAPGQAVGMSLSDLFERPEDLAKSKAAHTRALAGESLTIEHEVFGRTFKTYIEPQWNDAGEVEGVAGLAFDVTDFSAKAHALAESEAHVARTERTAQTGSWMHDLATNRLTFSPQAQRMFGIDPGASRGEAFYRRVVPEDRERVRAQVRAAYESEAPSTFEFRIVVDGAIRFIRESIEGTRDAQGRLTRADGILVDITERRLAELEAYRRAYTSEVTGLPNLAALRAYVDREGVDGNPAIGSVLMVNIDRFRSVNDALGSAVGDRLLHSVGARLQTCSPNTYVACVENDTFAVVLGPEIDAAKMAERLQAAFRAPFDLGEMDFAVTISIGIATAEWGKSADSIVRMAQVAMRAARAAGGDRTVAFTTELESLRARKLSLYRDLQRAVDRDEFALVYQPIVGALGEVVALEALLRWHHPAYGLIRPDEFIPLAEENGTIVTVGHWVLHSACEEIARIRRVCGKPIRLAVNISPRQFSDPDLLEAIADAFSASGLPPEAVEIEITEGTIASDPAQATRVLRELRSAGVTVAIDDFGTGYSSLAHLRRFPLDALKIDRSFVAVTPDDTEACAIVDAILALARQLSLNVVAEGVETKAQAEYLRSKGCTLLQGYYFSRPLPAGLIADFVSDNR